MKLVVAVTGASGAIYAQRLLDNLEPDQHELHVIVTRHGREVATLELGPNGLRLPAGARAYQEDGSMRVPFVSGSARLDAMVIIPASMGTVGRIAQGVSDSTVTRAADVFLKERRPLILVPRETPCNLIHLRNLVALTEAGAVVLPANPSFYGRPQTITDLVDTVVARVLDHLGLEHRLGKRWPESAPD